MQITRTISLNERIWAGRDGRTHPLRRRGRTHPRRRNRRVREGGIIGVNEGPIRRVINCATETDLLNELFGRNNKILDTPFGTNGTRVEGSKRPARRSNLRNLVPDLVDRLPFFFRVRRVLSRRIRAGLSEKSADALRRFRNARWHRGSNGFVLPFRYAGPARRIYARGRTQSITPYRNPAEEPSPRSRFSGIPFRRLPYVPYCYPSFSILNVRVLLTIWSR